MDRKLLWYYFNKGMGQPGGASLTYLLRDEFVTAESAPLTSPRTAEPGPGTLTLVQTDGQFSISGGKLQIPAQSTPAYGDQHIVSAAISRAAGRAAYFAINLTASDKELAVGWFDSTTPHPTVSVEHIAWFFASGTDLYFRESTIGSAQEDYSGSVDYRVGLVLRTAGCFSVIRGGAFADWTLAWVSDANSTASLYAGLANRNHTGTFDSIRVADLPSPWDTDHDIATTRLAGARSAGDTFTHAADALIEFTVTTLPSSGQAEVFFRVQDASNYWAVTVDSTGALNLDEVVAGSPTQRGTSAAAVSNGSRVVVVAAGTTIKVYVDNGLDINYTSASNFQTETAGELDTEGTGGSVSDIIAWPRTLSGSAAAALNKL